MLLRTSRTDAIAIAASVVFAIGGMLFVGSGNAAGWWLLLACSLTSALVILRPLVSMPNENDGESLDISPWGVRRHDGTGLHEAVSWSDLSEVAVVTTADTPDTEDVYLVLRGRNHNRLVVPHSLAVESGILSELHLRLSEFDSEAFIDALSSTVDKVFVLWRAPTPVSPLRSGARATTPIQLRAAS
jgi:hypothetical protein